MNRFPLIVGNWKMNTTLADAIILTKSVKRGLEDIHHIEVALCPPFPWIVPMAEVVKHNSLNHLHVGAQNVYIGAAGAFTGEVSAEMLRHLCKYVIVGHSERIRYFHETPELVGQKALSVLEAGMTPIICVGEKEKTNRSKSIVVQTLADILTEIPRRLREYVVVAYEPVWAISTTPDSEPATSEYAQTVCHGIRKAVDPNIPILYGGSVDSDTIAEFIHEDDIDGALVGGASLKAKEFLKICEIASEIKK